MSAFGRMPAFVLVCAFACLMGRSVAQENDLAAAARVLGPNWKQISRKAGQVFIGTVLRVEAHRAQRGSPVPTVEMKLHVDLAIAGARKGTNVTVREWEGAWSGHRALRSGEHVLLLLYPASRLGLTSPVGGTGEVSLDARGEIDLQHHVSVAQLTRAIRSARGDYFHSNQ